MDSELSTLIKSVKEKTGIDVTVFTEDLKYVFSTNNNKEIVYPTDGGFTGVYQDIMTGNTYFKLKYKNGLLTGYVRGVGATDRNYAYLITDIIESASYRELSLSEEEYLKSILLGECNRPQIQRFLRKFGVKDMPCFALSVCVTGAKKSDVMDVLTSFEGSDVAVFMEEGHYAYVKFTGEGEDYQSATEFSTYLAQSIKEETGATVNIGVGATVKGVAEINSSYQQALMAERLCAVMNAKGEVHSFKEFVLLKMLEDLPKYKLSEYLSVLLDENAKEIFSDAEMINTAEEFLDNSLNISETARKLYLHRNTLMYRLDKIERETGLNIRNFSDAITFRLITVLSKLVK